MALLVAFGAGCSLIVPGAGDDSAADSDSDSDSDIDSDTDTDSDADTDSDTDTDTDCTPESYQQCADGHVHWFDSCGNLGEVATECSDNSMCVDTTATTAECQCFANWTNPPACDTCAPGWYGDGCSVGVLFVSFNALGMNNGLSWADAFVDIRVAAQQGCAMLATAIPGSALQLWVAGGYYPVSAGDPSDTLQLCEGLQVLGGFAGYETDPTSANPDSNQVMVDGAMMSYHVVTGATNTLLDGLTITGGNAVGSLADASVGGGLFVPTDAWMTVSRCTFFGNTASAGGAVRSAGNLTASDCHFHSNNAVGDGGTGPGGAIYAAGGNLDIEACRFSNNTATAYGGAIYASTGVSDSAIVSSVFQSNTTSSMGGAISFDNGVMISDSIFVGNSSVGTNGAFDAYGGISSLTNCVFLGNRAEAFGGAVGIQAASLTAMNCTFWANVSGSYGGAIAQVSDSAMLTLTNSILYADTPEELYATSGAPQTITYSDVQGITPDADAHVIAADPQFSISETGAVTSVVSFSFPFVTTLVLSGITDASTLVGGYLHIIPPSGDPTWWAVISGEGDSVWVLGSTEATVAPGDIFEFWTLRPGTASGAPCIDTGTPSGAPAYDLSGVMRFDYAGFGDSGATVDMGAYEAVY